MKSRSGLGTKEKGFTLVELVIVMAVIAVILSVVIPNLRGMQAESQLTKAEGELNTLKSAITSYWRNNSTYPQNIRADLVNASPQIISAPVSDPFNTDGSGSYGFQMINDPTFGLVWCAWTKGPKADTLGWAWDNVNQKALWTGGGRLISNAPTLHQ